MEKEIEDIDGNWFRVRIMPYRTSDDRIEGLVLTFLDTTDHHKKLSNILNNQTHYDLIFEHSNEVYFLLDINTMEEYRYLSVNKAFLEMTHLKRENVIGKKISEVLSKKDSKELFLKYKNVINEGKPHTYELEPFLAKEKGIFAVTITPILDDSKRCFSLLGVARAKL